MLKEIMNFDEERHIYLTKVKMRFEWQVSQEIKKALQGNQQLPDYILVGLVKKLKCIGNSINQNNYGNELRVFVLKAEQNFTKQFLRSQKIW